MSQGFSHSCWVGSSKSWVWWTQGHWTQTSVEQKFLTVVREAFLGNLRMASLLSCGMLHAQKNLLPDTILSVWKQKSKRVFMAGMMCPGYSRFPCVHLLTCEIMLQSSGLQKLIRNSLSETAWVWDTKVTWSGGATLVYNAELSVLLRDRLDQTWCCRRNSLWVEF